MNTKWIQSALMGFVCGFSEPLPMSADANLGVLRGILGLETGAPLFMLLCHAVILTVVVMTGRLDLRRLRRAYTLSRTPARRRSAQPDLLSVNTLKLLPSAVLMILVSRLLSVRLAPLADKMYILPLFLVFGGLLLWLPAHMRSGNKDARNMEKTDGLVMGAVAALSAFPGISLVGACVSAGSVQGISRRYALRFAWLLLSVSLCAAVVTDFLALMAAGFSLELTELLCALVGAAFAGLGAYLAVKLMYVLVGGMGISGFCYYNWGLALLCLILFLLV